MLLLTLGQTAENIVVTLNEKRTLDNGYYLFIFTHLTTKATVSKIYSFVDDDSTDTERYNQFEINTNTVFSGARTGQWKYQVYEQASSSNTDPTGLTEVERGIMQLNPATAFSFNNYNEQQTFKTYNG